MEPMQPMLPYHSAYGRFRRPRRKNCTVVDEAVNICASTDCESEQSNASELLLHRVQS